MKYTLNDTIIKSSVLAHIENIDMGKKPVYTVEILPFKKKRSCPQNSYYWGVVLKIISNYTGYKADELHEMFKLALLPKKQMILGNISKEIPTSTTELSTLEFIEYIEEISQFAAESLALVIPAPNDPEYYVSTI